MTSLLDRLQRWLRATRPVDPEAAAVLAERWASLPEHVKTPAQLLGRRIAGCEGTHGAFPACDFACKPCYHSADANKVPVNGAHTVAEVERQMVYLRRRRGPSQHAQLIGGEVTLLSPADHAEALEAMRRNGRMPMSMTHGDFDYGYLERLVLQDNGSRRFEHVAFAAHIDSTMHGRTGFAHPTSEEELQPAREAFCAMFRRLRDEHGVRSHLAHNMTITADNVDQIPDVIRASRRLGFRVFSFQPAAYVGNEQRWREGYRAMTDDDVWARIEQGAGTRLPYRAVEVGDIRCNRTTWGVFVGDRYVPLLDDREPRDLALRDSLFTMLPGNLLFAPRWQQTVRVVRSVARAPRVLPQTLGWLRRMVGRAGGVRSLRHGVQSVTFIMHNFMDARDVAPAWQLLQQGIESDEPRIKAAQERLQACSYHMAHPESDELVPACVQHSVLDPMENRELVTLLAAPRRRVFVSDRDAD
ncbi:MAG: radical SAM domain-containing protein [Acidimicrobiia bacterium]